MLQNLSISMITLNAEDTIEESLKSVYGWVKEIVIVDSYSSDKTIELAKKYGARVYQHHYEGEGSQRNYALTKINTEWVFALDADEVVTEQVKNEIHSTLQSPQYSGFKIPFQSIYKNRKLNHGGEQMVKMVLFKKILGHSTPDQIHAVYKTKDGNVGMLTNKIKHYSYLSIINLFSKFHSYGIREARMKKSDGEKTSLKKIFMYPAHMLWARFIADKGYKDGLLRLPIDIAFAYKELVVYTYLLWI